MKWVEIFLMKGDIERVVTRLHEERILEVREVEKARSRPERMEEQLKLHGRVLKILDFLSQHGSDGPRGLRALIPGPPERFNIDESDLNEKVNSWLRRLEREIYPMIRSENRMEEDISFIAELREKLLKLSGLNMELGGIEKLERTRVRVGISRDFPALKRSIEGRGWVEGSLLSKKESLHAVRLIYPASLEGEMGARLKGAVFSEMTMDLSRLQNILVDNGYPSSTVSLPVVDLLGALDDLEKKVNIRAQKVGGRAYEISRSELAQARAWEESISIKLDKMKLSFGLFSTTYTNRISGWVERGRLTDMKQALKEEVGERYEISARDPKEEEIDQGEVPTSLTNNRFNRIFEPLTLTFSPPRYNEIDPTTWFSIPYILFFGLMLGDAGYGLLIMLGSYFIYRLGEDPSIKRIGSIGMLMGATTLIAGLWMGAFFGDLVPRVLMGNEAGALYGPFDLPLIGTVPYDTLRDPMLLFSISLYLGLAQLNIGLLLLGVDRIKKGNFWGFVKGTISWVLIQAGAIILVGGFMLGWYELTQTLTFMGLGLFILGAGLLVFEVGAMFMFNIEGYLGDWISYSRILALGLSTFGLAMAFNIVGVMLIDITPFLIPVTLILLVFLHIFNLMLQTLGSAVHSLRLQYVEFFGRFYEGGGVLFSPFGRERTFTTKGGRAPGGGGD